MVPIEFYVALVKNPENADVVLETGGGDLKGLLIPVPRDIDETHPKYEDGIVEGVNKGLIEDGITIKGYDVRAVRTAHNIPEKGEFVWVGDRTRYNERFIEWLLNRYHKNNAFFSEAREEALKLIRQSADS